MDKGASASQTGPSQVEPVPVSPLRASVPSADDPETWVCGCVGHQIKAMMAMADTPTDFPVLSFATISKWSGLTLEQTRLAVRQLADKGVAEFWRGCWSDDGEPCGSGYALTKQGRIAAQAIEARRAETPSGSVHESAVGETDAPNSTPETSQVQP